MADHTEKRRKAILLFIASYLDQNHFPPSYREICSSVKIPSTSTVAKDIAALVEAGYLTKEKDSNRSLRLVEARRKEYMDASSQAMPYREDVHDIPVYGAVAAGAPIYAEDHIEDTVPLPATFFPNDGADYFVLEIHGDSMLNAGIFDGDHVIVRRQDHARKGQQVVALIDDEATVKSYYPHPGYIELRPENPNYSPILVDDCRILGIVCGLYRLY